MLSLSQDVTSTFSTQLADLQASEGASGDLTAGPVAVAAQSAPPPASASSGGSSSSSGTTGSPGSTPEPDGGGSSGLMIAIIVVVVIVVGLVVAGIVYKVTHRSGVSVMRVCVCLCVVAHCLTVLLLLFVQSDTSDNASRYPTHYRDGKGVVEDVDLEKVERTTWRSNPMRRNKPTA